MEKSKNMKTKKSFWRKIAEILGTYGQQLNKVKKQFEKLISGWLKKTNVNVDFKKLREYSGYALYTAFGFLMSIVTLPQSIKPLGISAICAMSDKNSVLFTYIGAAFGCITYGKESLSSFIVYFMLYAVRKTFTESKFAEKTSIKMLTAAATSAVIGIIRICTAAESALYSYIAFLTSACISVSYTYFFSTLFDKKEYSGAKMSTVSICSYALMAGLVLSFDGIFLFGFNVQLLVCCLITLSYAVVNGFLHAGTVGFICGIATASPVISACLGLSGIVSSLLLSKSILASAISFVAVFFSVAAYSAGLGTGATLLPSVLCGCVLFFPICGLLPESFRLNTKAARITAKPSNAGISATSGKKLSEAFFSISDIFSRLAEKQKYPSYTDIDIIVDKTFSEVCAGCALSEMCFAKKKTDMDELKQTFFVVLNNRPIQKEDFGSNMKDKCIRLENHTELINKYHRELMTAKASDNRPQLLGAQYAGMARLLQDAGQKSSAANERDAVFEKKISEALKQADVPFSTVLCHSEREKNTVVHGIHLDRIPFGADELKKYLYSRLAVKITEPSFDISEKNDYVMSFCRACSLRMEYAQVTKSGKYDEVNGDTVSFMHGKNHYFRALICDGMGSGRDAAASSRLASLFLEKMLETDAEKGIILELLNTALMSRSYESFSTIDLLETDLLTGRSVFIKAGAAPTYIIRTGKLYKIFSATPPIGIISGFTTEVTRFSVEPGDVIIMVSDGVIPNNEDSAWLAQLIKLDVTKDAPEIAGDVLEYSEEINSRTDDVSICVIKAVAEES